MRYLATFALAFGIAVGLCVYALPQWAALILGGSTLLLGVLILVCHKPSLRRIGLVCLGLAVGFFWTQLYAQLVIQPAKGLTGESVCVYATIADYPSATDYGCYTTAKISTGVFAVQTAVYLDDDAMELQPGDRIRFTAKIVLASELDSDYYQSSGVFLVAYGSSYQMVLQEDGSSWQYFPAKIKHYVQDKINRIYSEDTAPFLLALLTGDRSALQDSLKTNMKTAGVYHAIAISGMHMSILIGYLGLLIRHRRRRACIGIPLVLLFMAMIGSAPGVTRAGIMQLIVLSGMLLKREYDSPTALGVSVLILLGLNPWAIQNTGFQLSFASTAGILLFSKRIYRGVGSSSYMEAIEKHLPFTKATGNPLLNAIAASIATTLGALVFSLPIMAWYYGTVSLISPVSNLLLLGAVTACFGIGLTTLVLPTIISTAMAWLCSWLVKYIYWMVGLLAHIPFASISISSIYVLIWLVLVYCILLAVLLGRGKSRPLIPICSVVLSLCLCLLLSARGYTNATWSFSVLDVGQGQCLAIYGEGINAIIDCGSNNNAIDAGEIAAQFLIANGQTSIDALILTHFDSDHCNGVATLMERISIAALYVPEVEDDAGNREKILAAAQTNQIPVYGVSENITLCFGACTLQIYAPVSDSDDNEACLSMLFSCDQWDALITGDMSQASEQLLLEREALPDIELLIVGHHGSKYSTGTALLEAVTPEIAVISVGENSYGHPTAETLLRLEEAGVEVYRTDQSGTVSIQR